MDEEIPLKIPHISPMKVLFILIVVLALLVGFLAYREHIVIEKYNELVYEYNLCLESGKLVVHNPPRRTMSDFLLNLT